MSFVVFGPPVPKARARAGKDGRHHTPKRTRDYEKLVKTIAGVHVPPGWPLDAHYRLHLRIFFPNRRTRDFSNVQKSVEDAMNKVAYHDDSQLVSFGPQDAFLDRDNPRVEVRLEVIERRW